MDHLILELHVRLQTQWNVLLFQTQYGAIINVSAVLDSQKLASSVYAMVLKQEIYVINALISLTQDWMSWLIFANVLMGSHKFDKFVLELVVELVTMILKAVL